MPFTALSSLKACLWEYESLIACIVSLDTSKSCSHSLHLLYRSKSYNRPTSPRIFFRHVSVYAHPKLFHGPHPLSPPLLPNPPRPTSLLLARWHRSNHPYPLQQLRIKHTDRRFLMLPRRRSLILPRQQPLLLERSHVSRRLHGQDMDESKLPAAVHWRLAILD